MVKLLSANLNHKLEHIRIEDGRDKKEKIDL